MTKSAKSVYDFTKLDADKKLQRFLSVKRENEGDPLNIKKCKAWIDWYSENKENILFPR